MTDPSPQLGSKHEHSPGSTSPSSESPAWSSPSSNNKHRYFRYRVSKLFGISTEADVASSKASPLTLPTRETTTTHRTTLSHEVIPMDTYEAYMNTADVDESESPTRSSSPHRRYVSELDFLPDSKKQIFYFPEELQATRWKLLHLRKFQLERDYMLDERWELKMMDEISTLVSKSQMLELILGFKMIFEPFDEDFTLQLFKVGMLPASHGKILDGNKGVSPSVVVSIPTHDLVYPLIKSLMRFLCDDYGYDYTSLGDYLCKLAIAGLMLGYDDSQGCYLLRLCVYRLPLKKWEGHDYGTLVTTTILDALDALWERDGGMRVLTEGIKVYR